MDVDYVNTLLDVQMIHHIIAIKAVILGLKDLLILALNLEKVLNLYVVQHLPVSMPGNIEHAIQSMKMMYHV
jgi:hypothetical protein